MKLSFMRFGVVLGFVALLAACQQPEITTVNPENTATQTSTAAATQEVMPSTDTPEPTSTLTEIPTPDFVQGVSLVPMLKNPNAPGHSALAYSNGMSTLRTDQYRITRHDDGSIELYDHASSEKETRNIAKENPELVAKLTQQLNAKKMK